MNKRSLPEVTPQGVKFEDEVMPLISGEIHYWRIDPVAWRPALEYLKLSGANTVATYVPWDQHEINEGYTSLTAPLTYDFTGVTAPRNNLCGFLELANGLGLKAIIRPGPAIIAEWKHKGPPLHSFAYDWPDEGYVTALRRWFRAVGAIINRYSWCNHGPIILCQPDNEGHELTQPGFAMFLESRYADVKSFNSEFRTDYASFSAAAEILCRLAPHNVLQRYVTELNTDNQQLRKLKSVAKEWFHERFLEGLHQELREAGVDLPFVINVIGNPLSTNYHLLHERHATLGMDSYPADRMRGGHWYFSEYAANYFAHVSLYPYMAEFGTSSFLRAWCLNNGPVRPEHLERVGLLYWANGIRGFNYYMFMDRDQCFGSPLDAGARPTENYFALFHLHRVMGRMSFNQTVKIEKVALLWVREWAQGKSVGQKRPDRDWLEIESYPESYIDHPAFRKVHTALVDSDASFAILELAELGKYDLSQYDLLLLPAGPHLSDPAKKALDGLEPGQLSKINMVGDGISYPGIAHADLGKLLEERMDIFFPVRLSHMPGVRSFVHSSPLGILLFVFNRTPRAIEVHLPDCGKKALIDVSNLMITSPEAPLLVEGHGQRIVLLTDSPGVLIQDRMMAMEYE